MAFEKYPYSSFGDLNLDWILEKVREAVETATNTEADQAALRDFVETYFANLDVQEEINTKLAAMGEDGSLGEIVDPYVVSATAEWLAANITPTSPPVDASLSVAGAAADAAKVGELKSALDYKVGEISEKTDNLFSLADIKIGMMANGAQNSQRAISEDIFSDTKIITVKAYNLPPNLKYEIQLYETGEISSHTAPVGGWVTDTRAVSTDRLQNTYSHFRILFASVDDNDLTAADFSELRMQVNVGNTILPYTPYLDAKDRFARSSTDKINKSIEYSDGINLFDNTTFVIGLNAAGASAANSRALSGAMRVDGEATIRAYNLPANIKYEIDYYSSEEASSYVRFYTGWITNYNKVIYAQKYPYIRILLASIDGTDITPADVADVKIFVTKTVDLSDKYLKIATWNVGLWYNGTPHGMDLDLLYKWYRVIGKMNADVLLTQESPLELHPDSNLKYGDLMGFKYDYLYLPNANGSYMEKGIASKLPLFDVTKNAFTDTSRTYIKGYFYTNGKKVCFINTHLSSGSGSGRDAQIAELIGVMNNEEYVILCGDFNVADTSEFDAFTNAGYKIANHGRFGDYITCPNDTTNKVLDNCIVSPNIEIQYAEANEETGSEHISDHLALVIILKVT